MVETTSVEYTTLVRCTPDLLLAVKADILLLGAQLVAEELITPDKYREIINPYNPLEKRAAELVQLVQDKVRQNAQYYRIFRTVLEKDCLQYSDILEKLHHTYKATSSHNTGMFYAVMPA